MSRVYPHIDDGTGAGLCRCNDLRPLGLASGVATWGGDCPVAMRERIAALEGERDKARAVALSFKEQLDAALARIAALETGGVSEDHARTLIEAGIREAFRSIGHRRADVSVLVDAVAARLSAQPTATLGLYHAPRPPDAEPLPTMRPRMAPAVERPPISPPRSCNRHDDCNAVDAAAKANNEPPVYHCHNDECEECFGC